VDSDRDSWRGKVDKKETEKNRKKKKEKRKRKSRDVIEPV